MVARHRRVPRPRVSGDVLRLARASLDCSVAPACGRVSQRRCSRVARHREMPHRAHLADVQRCRITSRLHSGRISGVYGRRLSSAQARVGERSGPGDDTRLDIINALSGSSWDMLSVHTRWEVRIGRPRCDWRNCERMHGQPFDPTRWRGLQWLQPIDALRSTQIPISGRVYLKQKRSSNHSQPRSFGHEAASTPSPFRGRRIGPWAR